MSLDYPTDIERFREALRRVFDNEVTFTFMAKGMASGGYPLGEDGQRRWSDWLADQVGRELEAL